MNRKTLSFIASIALAVGLLGLFGCENGNLFGKLHKSGDSNDVVVLQSDAQIALDHGDYTSALRLFEDILAQDPDNSNALNGKVFLGFYVPSCQLDRYRVCSGVSLSMAMPMALSFSRATSRSMFLGTS